jgi:CRISPR system Cascade subunit CasB
MSTAPPGRNAAATTEEVDAFVGRLERADKGDLARLKRNAGQPLGESRGALPVFYRLLPRAVRRERDVEAYFLVATLFPLSPGRWQGDFGRTLRAVARAPGVNRKRVDRRAAALLDAHREELPFRLRHAVRLAASAGRHVDWRQTLADLLRWEHPRRPVQKSWARSYFGDYD